jgi:hypothetical protein
MVSVTFLALYARGKSPPYLSDRRLGRPQNRPGRDGIEKKDPTIVPRQELKPGRPARSLIFVITELVCMHL